MATETVGATEWSASWRSGGEVCSAAGSGVDRIALCFSRHPDPSGQVPGSQGIAEGYCGGWSGCTPWPLVCIPCSVAATHMGCATHMVSGNRLCT